MTGIFWCRRFITHLGPIDLVNRGVNLVGHGVNLAIVDDPPLAFGDIALAAMDTGLCQHIGKMNRIIPRVPFVIDLGVDFRRHD